MMRSILALVLVFGVYVVGPAVCLAGTDAHACACDEATCPNCQSDPSHSTHGCHDDPCPDVSLRLEQDDPSVHQPSAQCLEQLAALLDNSPALPALSFTCCGSSPLPVQWREVFAAEGLPLLI